MEKYDSYKDMLERDNMTIKCWIVHNNKCIKCDAVEEEMVQVGVSFTMCNSCWKEEFGEEKFDRLSPKGETFSKWVKISKQKMLNPNPV